MAILECETSVQIGEGLTCARTWRSFLAARFDCFSSYRNYRWGDSGSIFGSNMASEAISECLISKILLGEHAPTPPSLFTLKRTQWPYQSKIAGSVSERGAPEAEVSVKAIQNQMIQMLS